MVNWEVFEKPMYKLYEALVECRLDEVKELLSANLDLDIHRISESEKWSYLHKVSKTNDTPPETIEFLIAEGLDVNAIDNYQRTPLFWAVCCKNVDVVRVLLENGADKLIDHKDRAGKTLLCYVHESYEMIKLLLDAGANPDNPLAEVEGARSFREYVIDAQDYHPPIPQEIVDLVAKY